MTRFSLPGDDAPVDVELTVPAHWELRPTADGPQWRFEGALLCTVTAISPRGDDDAARVARAITMQYDDDAEADRVALSNGRVWVARPDGDNLHARMFVPYPGGVVMGVVILEGSAAAQLPAVKAAFETLAIA